MNRFLPSPIILALLGAGCLSLTPEETKTLERLRRSGYTLDSPPADFKPPTDSGVAAGLNVLPGIGNFYLAHQGGGGMQWALGAGNLLLWPFSPLWSVAEGYSDARTLNRRALAAYGDLHPDLPPHPVPVSSPVAFPSTPDMQTPEQFRATPSPPPYDITTVESYTGGRAVYRVTIQDPSKTAFDIERIVRPEIERIVREAFESESFVTDRDSVRVAVIPDFCENRTILFTAMAFSAEPVADGWTYDADSRRGTVRLRVTGRVDADAARRWARQNIANIVRDKNIALSSDAGTPPPLGATFRSLGESLEDGILTVEFEAVQ